MVNQGSEQKIWDKIIAPIAIGFDDKDPFSQQDCLNSALTILQYKLAEKINFGIVLVWDKNQEMWTNFYAWHCWTVSKYGQPFDCSVFHWKDIFSHLNPPIIPEKNPLEMSCQLIYKWGNRDCFNRNEFRANAIYANGSMTNQNIHLVPDPIKKAIYLSGKFNGLNLTETLNLLQLK